MSEVKRKKGETFEGLLRRFNKKIIQSGKILQARKIRVHARPLSDSKQKKLALHRKDVKNKMAYLIKIGELPEDAKGLKK